MIPLAPDYIRQLEPYVAGKSIPNLIKLASNENPFGPSPKALLAAQAMLPECHLYPINHRTALKEKIVQFHAGLNLKPDQIVVGNGSTELITLITRTLVGPGEAVLNAWPSFLMYRLSCRAQGREEITVPLTQSLDYDLDAMAAKAERAKVVFLANPNNPTGRYITQQALERFLNQIAAHVVVVMDEAYTEFVQRADYPNGLVYVRQRPRTIVLRTFSKVYGLAGFRVAYAVCDPQIAELLHRVRDPFNVNSLAQVAALAALDDQDHVQKSTDSNGKEMLLVERRLTELGIQFTPSAGNFILCHFKNANLAYEQLINSGVVVRQVANYDLPKALRITIGTPEQNQALFTGLKGLDS